MLYDHYGSSLRDAPVVQDRLPLFTNGLEEVFSETGLPALWVSRKPSEGKMMSMR